MTAAAGEQLQPGARATSLDEVVYLIGFATMLALARAEKIDLTAAGWPGAGILTAHSEEEQLRHISKVETYTAAIGATVLAHFVPHDVRFVVESPGSHNLQSLWEKGVGNPKI
ncbi:MAG: hypothetical protein QOK17_1533 [Sphingomonadales bacterium]|nr:hypothetical protein [Sphingomonadales bacterium]